MNIEPKEDGPSQLQANQAPLKPKVRPIQMGEYMRKYISRRILAAEKAQLNAAMRSLRQWGVGA
eukprot:2810879-Karenia_brevis.AAC.1